MKIAIGHPDDLPDWTPFPTDFLTPRQVRDALFALPDDARIVTRSPVVLRFVGYAWRDSDVARYVATYEDVSIRVDDRLVPLLDLHSADWLSHFDLGDLYVRGDLVKEDGLFP